MAARKSATPLAFALVTLLAALACSCRGCAGQSVLNNVAQLAASAQDTLGTICEDERLKLLMKPVCEPGGEAAKAIAAAKKTDAPELVAISDVGTLSGGEQVRTQGGNCTVDPKRVDILRTDLLMDTAYNGTGPRPADNWLVVNLLERINANLAQFVAQDESGGDGNTEDGFATEQAATYIIRSDSSAFCAAGMQCEFGSEAVGESGEARGTCQNCRPGRFCPPGSVSDATGTLFSDSLINLCPQGFFCPDAATAKNCPPGMFCPAGSSKPIECNGIAFNASRTSGDNTFEFVAELKGNYCPINTAEPLSLCPPGYFCPNATVAYACPRGFSCPSSSLAPLPCPFLSSCPPGSAAPSISWMALIAFCCVLAFVYGTSFLIRWFSKQQAKRQVAQFRPKEWTEAVAQQICKTSLPDKNYIKICAGLNLEGLAFVDDPFVVDIQDLSVKLGKRVILDNVSIQFPAATINAIFGPSGAGKTTVIKSALGKIAGNLWLGGKVRYVSSQTGREHVIYRSGKRKCMPARQACHLIGDPCGSTSARCKIINLQVGYVPQDNVLYENLTVFENLSFSVRIRNKDRGDKCAMIMNILGMLGLTKISHTIAGTPDQGGISGGESRRLSIGLELAGSPKVLILDEPTTGLDAVSADKILTCLKSLARSGMTIVASIHQPKSSIYHLFDQVHVLMRGGFVVYSGTKDAAIPYFDRIGFQMPLQENPADFMLDIVSGMVNRVAHPEFTTEDLPGIWEEERLRRSQQESEAARDSSPFSIGKGEEVEEMCSYLTTTYKYELQTNPAFEGMEEHFSEAELRNIICMICGSCCELKLFDYPEQCLKHMHDQLADNLGYGVQPTALAGANGNGNGAMKNSSSANGIELTPLSPMPSYGHTEHMGYQELAKPEPKPTLLTTQVGLAHKDLLGWVRSLGMKSVDIFTTAFFALVLGFNQGAGVKTTDDILFMSLLSTMYVGMLSVIWAEMFMLKRLDSAKREAGGQVPTMQIYMGAMLVDLIDNIVRPLVFCLVFYYVSLPKSDFGRFFVVVLGNALSCSGLGYFIALLMPESIALVAGLVVAYTFGGVLNGVGPKLTDLPSVWIAFPSYARWSIEAMSLNEFDKDPGWPTQIALEEVGYSFDNWVWCLVWLFCSALVFRVIAFPLFRRRALA